MHWRKQEQKTWNLTRFCFSSLFEAKSEKKKNKSTDKIVDQDNLQSLTYQIYYTLLRVGRNKEEEEEEEIKSHTNRLCHLKCWTSEDDLKTSQKWRRNTHKIWNRKLPIKATFSKGLFSQVFCLFFVFRFNSSHWGMKNCRKIPDLWRNHKTDVKNRGLWTTDNSVSL